MSVLSMRSRFVFAHRSSFASSFAEHVIRNDAARFAEGRDPRKRRAELEQKDPINTTQARSRKS